MESFKVFFQQAHQEMRQSNVTASQSGLQSSIYNIFGNCINNNTQTAGASMDKDNNNNIKEESNNNICMLADGVVLHLQNVDELQ